MSKPVFRMIATACVAALMLFAAMGTLRVYAGIAAMNFVADIHLADDASTPDLKAKYLGDFIAKAESERLPENVSAVMPTSQTNVRNTIDVIRSLKQRCDDLAAVTDKGSLGYAQGMQQITGQEFDHALEEPMSRMEDAMIISRMSWPGYWLWMLSAMMAFMSVVTLMVSTMAAYEPESTNRSVLARPTS